MEALLLNLEALSSINKYAPDIARYSIFIVLLILLFIPLSFALWLISLALDKTIGNLAEGFYKTSTSVFSYAKNIKNNAVEHIKIFYKNYSTIINYDNPSYKFSGHPVQNEIDKLQKELLNAPNLLKDKNDEKVSLLKKLNENLSRLSKKIKELELPTIPGLEQNQYDETKRRNASRTLVVGIFIMISIMLVNSFTLNIFFRDLFGGRKILEIPLSAIVAILFTVIEVSTGYGLVYFERFKKSAQDVTTSNIVKGICAFVVISLALVEFYLYLLVSTSGYKREFAKAMIAGDWFKVFFQLGGVLAFLGPCIVLMLFVLGHLVSTAYFDFTTITNYKKFKDELDSQKNQIKKAKEEFDSVKEDTKGIIGEIKKADIKLETENDKSFALKVNEFTKVLQMHTKDIGEAVNNAEKIKIPPPEIEARKMQDTETEAFLRKNILYLLAIVSSTIIIHYILLNISSNFESALFSLVTAILLVTLSLVLGLLSYPKVKIFTTQKGEIAKLVLQPPGNLQKVLSIFIFILLVSVAVFSLEIVNSSANITYFILFLLSVSACFFSGRNLTQSISSWVAFTRYIYFYFGFCVSFIFAILIKFIADILKFLIILFNGLGYPARYLLGR